MPSCGPRLSCQDKTQEAERSSHQNPSCLASILSLEKLPGASAIQGSSRYRHSETLEKIHQQKELLHFQAGPDNMPSCGPRLSCQDKTREAERSSHQNPSCLASILCLEKLPGASAIQGSSRYHHSKALEAMCPDERLQCLQEEADNLPSSGPRFSRPDAA